MAVSLKPGLDLVFMQTLQSSTVTLVSSHLDSKSRSCYFHFWQPPSCMSHAARGLHGYSGVRCSGCVVDNGREFFEIIGQGPRSQWT